MSLINQLENLKPLLLDFPQSSSLNLEVQSEDAALYLIQKLQYLFRPLVSPENSFVKGEDFQTFKGLGVLPHSDERLKQFLVKLYHQSPVEQDRIIADLFEHVPGSINLLVLVPHVSDLHLSQLGRVLRNELADDVPQASKSINLLAEVLPEDKFKRDIVDSISMDKALESPLSLKSFKLCVLQNRMSTDELFSIQLLRVLGQLPNFEAVEKSQFGFSKVQFCVEQYLNLDCHRSQEDINVLQSVRFWKDQDSYLKEAKIDDDSLFSKEVSFDTCMALSLTGVFKHSTNHLSTPTQVIAHAVNSTLKNSSEALNSNSPEDEQKALNTLIKFPFLMYGKDFIPVMSAWYQSSNVDTKVKSDFVVDFLKTGIADVEKVVSKITASARPGIKLNF